MTSPPFLTAKSLGSAGVGAWGLGRSSVGSAKGMRTM